MYLNKELRCIVLYPFYYILFLNVKNKIRNFLNIIWLTWVICSEIVIYLTELMSKMLSDFLWKIIDFCLLISIKLLIYTCDHADLHYLSYQENPLLYLLEGLKCNRPVIRIFIQSQSHRLYTCLVFLKHQV